MRQFVTNEFNNSAIAKDQRDVRTTWAEAKPIVICCVITLVFLGVAFAKHY